MSFLAHIARGYGLHGRDSIPGRGKICLFSIASRPDLRSNQSPIQCVPGALSLEVKRPGREAEHSRSSSAEFKNGGAIPLFPHTFSWRGV
jgi:hypothetical protein